jgi:hypothetical protein
MQRRTNARTLINAKLKRRLIENWEFCHKRLFNNLYARQNDCRARSKAAGANDEDEYENDSGNCRRVDHPKRNDFGRRIIATCHVPKHPVKIFGKY